MEICWENECIDILAPKTPSYFFTFWFSEKEIFLSVWGAGGGVKLVLLPPV